MIYLKDEIVFTINLIAFPSIDMKEVRKMKNKIMTVFWVFIGLIVAILAIGITLNAIFYPRIYNGTIGYGGPFGMMGWGYGAGIWILGPLMMLIPLILLFFFIYWIFEISTGRSKASSSYEPQGSALEILDRRYANGEITREEYLKMKEEISKR